MSFTHRPKTARTLAHPETKQYAYYDLSMWLSGKMSETSVNWGWIVCFWPGSLWGCRRLAVEDTLDTQGQVHTKISKTKPEKPRNKTDTERKKSETNVHTHTYPTKHRHFLDVSVFCSVHSQWTAAAKWLRHVPAKREMKVTCARLRLAFYFSHYKN